MAYTKAGNVLPRKLIEAIQEYIDATTLYIPRKRSRRKAWGEVKQTRQRLAARNAAILAQYRAGMSVARLAALYCLSDKAIYKVLAAGKSR